MTTLPAGTDTGPGPAPGAWEPDGPPLTTQAAAAVAAVRALLTDLDAPPDLVRRVTTWSNLAGEEWVYIPALPLDVAQRLAAMGDAS